MSFQAYLDTIEKETGLTPRQLMAIAHEKGLDAPGTKASEILATSPQIPTFDLSPDSGRAILQLC